MEKRKFEHPTLTFLTYATNVLAESVAEGLLDDTFNVTDGVFF